MTGLSLTARDRSIASRRRRRSAPVRFCAIAEFELAAGALRPRLPEFDFATGYLEFARPTIRDGLAPLAGHGARRILAIPGMLFAASHVKNDLPWEINSFIAENPGIDVRLGRDLGIDPKLLRGRGRSYRCGG